MKHIHFVGIKGVGMTPLAIIAKQAGFTVTGCDVADAFITDESLQKEKISPLVGFDPAHLSTVDMVITTGAHGGMENREVKVAKEKGIPVLSQGQAVGEFMKGKLFQRSYKGISVAGCHGKTTTTAMVATILQKAGLDPSYVVGTSEIPSLGSSGQYGSGDYFIAEADEYATDPMRDKTPKFLWQHPYILAITNIDFDHPDIYASLADVEDAYKKCIENIGADGMLIINGDDSSCRKIVHTYKQRYIPYGNSNNTTYYFSNIIYKNNQIYFDIFFNQTLLGEIHLSLSGEHNVYNALCAFSICSFLGMSFDQIKQGLESFRGTRRRVEYVGRLHSGAALYDDYAHHPREIQTTLHGLKYAFPNKKIVCIFQPHTFSRTRMLFDNFIYSFQFADTIIVCDIYASQRETADDTVSAKKLAKSIQGSVLYIPTIKKVADFINKQNYGNDTILITMGAGDVYKVWDSIICRE